MIQEVISYLKDFPLEVIKESLIRTARKQKKWDYARGTLNNWLEQKIDTLEKIKIKDIELKNKDKPSNTENKKNINNYDQRKYENLDKFYANKESYINEHINISNKTNKF